MTDTTSEWRQLALQFDGQRMAAMVHLRTLLAMPTAHAQAARDFLSAAPAEQIASVQQWQPIESAPKDGTEVWAFNGEQGRMHWIEGEGYALWAWADELLSDVDPFPSQPTHFMPLPPNPGA